MVNLQEWQEEELGAWERRKNVGGAATGVAAAAGVVERNGIEVCRWRLGVAVLVTGV